MKTLGLLLLLAGCGGTATQAAPAAPVIPAPRSVAARPATPAPRSCGRERGLLRGDRIGALQIGMTVEEAKATCTIVRDTVEESEGEPARMLIVNAGGDTLSAHIWPENRISSIYTRSPRFQTADSIRVGVPLRRLLAFTDLSGGHGESAFVVFSNAPTICGLSFEIEFVRPDIELRGTSRAALMPYADSGRVKAVFARGCQ